ncbi:uncharacterized membrane protein (DUF485 family) [Kitasatospora sp. MAP12-15]|uniref:DUF485 domain-containing protein n=1 Tax=unclassified Kitasatospora TaxID=2633591 RepID=UPI0024732C5B|nr:DUF485 domain-containing protein [Kitasatospora sp. MAP12-44]MDH6113492.1 uncharacterized membrane protein (DUF485 family) [Kitasatospora sp. MAP12-44]
MDHPPQPGSSPDGTITTTDPSEVEQPEDSAEFRALRSSFRSFAFPVTAGFLLWYLLYVLLSCYAHGFMAATLFGHINVALVLGLLQFASTFAIAAWYARFADQRLDPPAARLRERYGYPTVVTPREAGE